MPTTALSLQAIAEQAGVSKMSVSRALANKPGVSAVTREKIVRIAREQSYRPNPLVTALMSNLRVQRSHRTVDRGTVLAFLERADELKEARTEHVAGARQAAEEQGYKLEPFVVGKVGLSPSRVNDILMARNIPGVLIGPLPEDHGHFTLDWSRLCTVTLEYTFTDPAFDRVVHDSYSSMRMVLNHCRSRGFHRVGLAFNRNGRDRTEGLIEGAYWMEQKWAGDFDPIPPLVLEDWDMAAGLAWFKRYNPQVIVTSSKFWIGLLTLLREMRLRVPEDISMVNVNVQPDFNDRRDPLPSGIDQNNRLIGMTGMRLLIDKINRNDRGIPGFPNTVLTPGSWFAGGTFGSAPAANVHHKKRA